MKKAITDNAGFEIIAFLFDGNSEKQRRNSQRFAVFCSQGQPQA